MDEISILKAELSKSQNEVKMLRARLNEPIHQSQTSIDYEGILLDEIKNSPSFKRCLRGLESGSIKQLSVNYQVEKEKIKEKWIKQADGTQTRDFDSKGIIDEEVMKRVEESYSKKTKRIDPKDGSVYWEE